MRVPDGSSIDETASGRVLGVLQDSTLEILGPRRFFRFQYASRMVIV